MTPNQYSRGDARQKAPDQTERAKARITQGLYTADVVVDHATARVIAASLHGGPGTALEQFAATGRFDVAILTREVAALNVARRQEVWREALLRYLDVARAKQPWTRATALRHTTADGVEGVSDRGEVAFSVGRKASPLQSPKSRK